MGLWYEGEKKFYFYFLINKKIVIDSVYNYVLWLFPSMNFPV